jgi:hypothetical protein
MNIYQAQPNRAFPCILPFISLANKEPIGYEFSTQFSFNTKEAHESLSSKNYIQYDYEKTPPRYLNEESFNPILIRLKNKNQIENIKFNEEIDYLHGLYETKYFKKKEDDFSFTIIDHPVNQIINIFYYIKYQITSKEEMDFYGYLLNLTEKEVIEEIKKFEIDLNDFEFPDLDPDAFNFKYTKDFFFKYKGLKNKEQKAIIADFQEYYGKYYIYMLIASSPCKDINTEEEWVDYFLSNPTLKDFISYKNLKFTYPSSYIHAKNLCKNHNFYGIMDTRKNLLKSLHCISKMSKNMFFSLSPQYSIKSPMDNFNYRKKEINDLLAEDIEFFIKKKEILENI